GTDAKTAGESGAEQQPKHQRRADRADDTVRLARKSDDFAPCEGRGGVKRNRAFHRWLFHSSIFDFGFWIKSKIQHLKSVLPKPVSRPCDKHVFQCRLTQPDCRNATRKRLDDSRTP